MKNLVLFISLFFIYPAIHAEVKPNSLFSNNMVLQRGAIVPVWGTAKDGEKITVDFIGQKLTTTAINGKWMIKLKPMKEGGPFTMIITGENIVTISNILIGEVWLCSGQSNMRFELKSVKALGKYPKVESVLSDANNYSNIRQFRVPLRKITSNSPYAEDVSSKWDVCDSATVGGFSAVAYFFAKELYNRLKVPVGIVNSSYGGTAAEHWIRREVLVSDPVSKEILTNYEKAINDFPSNLEKFKTNESKLFEKFRADSVLAAQQKKELPRKPTEPSSPADRIGPGDLFNSMINPILPFAIKGVAWYQGEANGSRGIQYRTLLPQLINNWRDKWGIGNFPFLIVQIPGWKGHKPELREAQLLTWQKTPNTAMTVINDCDDTVNVHPGNKQPVGERLSLAARAIAYGEKIEYSGPVYKSMKIDGNKIIISFTHIGSGLISKDGDLKDFVIAGNDKIFVPAKAEIKRDKIIVYAKEIENPSAVRLGWRLCPQVNLYNKEGLPATPFRTDVE
jgi:sialate O-acetylesterase